MSQTVRSQFPPSGGHRLRYRCEACGAPQTGTYEFRVGPTGRRVTMKICMGCAVHCRPTGGEA